MLLTGCNLPFDGVLPDQSPTLTPSTLEETATPSPTPILNTPTPFLEPTTEPDVAEQPGATPTLVPVIEPSPGDLAFKNGDWETAATEHRATLNDPSTTEPMRIDAQIGIAEVQIAQGDYISAVATLNQFLADYATDERAPQAYYLRGKAQEGLENWSAAIDDYEVYLRLRPGVIDSFVYERIAEAYLILGNGSAALDAFKQATAAGRYALGQRLLHQRVASVARSLNDAERAVAEYEAILSFSQDEAYKAIIELYIGQAWYEAGEFDLAYEQWERVFMTYPSSPEALSALRALLEAERPVNQYQRGLVNYSNGQFDVATEAFQAYLNTTETTDHNPKAYILLARSYRYQDLYPEAEQTIRTLLSLLNESSPRDITAEAELELAYILEESGRVTEGFAAYENVVSKYNDISAGADALYWAGQFAELQGDVAGAASYYQRLALLYPNDVRAADSLFELGFEAWQNNDLATAEALLRGTAELPANARPAQAYLWLGKTLEAAGRAEEAIEAYNLALQSDTPYGFYGIRANDLLTGQEPFTRPTTSINSDIHPNEGRAEAEQWLIETFNPAAPLPTDNVLSPELASDYRIVQGTELWELGELGEGRLSFENIRVEKATDAVASYQLAVYYRDIGLYRSSILAARAVYRVAGISAPNGPDFIDRLQYPTHFSDLIQADAEQYGLDPLYVYSLIWQESLFEGFAVSSASAQGLMQIWPPTGEDIAEALDWPDYQPSDLQRPVVSVAFGTWLLKDEFGRQNGNPFAVLAAYNAGTGNALTWARESDGDYDLYVENVSIAEPQRYIIRIYEHFSVYSHLYGE